MGDASPQETIQIDPPAGYTARAPSLADAEAVFQLCLPNSIRFNGEPDGTVQDLLDEWQEPTFSIQDDARLIISPAGEIVGYALLYEPHMPHVFIDVYVHERLFSGDPGVEDCLLRFCRRRAEAGTRNIPAGVRVAMRAYTFGDDTRYQAKLSGHGFTCIRHSFWMHIDLPAPPPPASPLSPPLSLHRIESRDDAVWREVFDVKRDAWRDHFGTIERDYENEYARWKHDWASHFQPGMWIAAVDGQRMVGICLCETGVRGNPKLAWVNTLGVRRSHRRRGIAQALLKEGFATCFERGCSRVGLGVDGASLTNAVQLYERAGMRVTTRFQLFECEIRPGEDIAIKNAGG